jgi:predicted dehydrogenase
MASLGLRRDFADSNTMKYRHVTRREFLRTSTLTAGLGFAAGVAPNLFLSSIKAATGENPSEFIRVGFIATGGQGMANMNALLKNAVAVCDVDQAHLATGAKKVEQSNPGRKCATYSDYRRLLESKDIDAVVVATPDHWHTLPAIHACQAGKDVYVEKPLTLTIDEGKALVKVAKATGRVVQTGSQQRSEAKFRRGCELVRNGYAGKIKEVRVGLPGVNWTKDPLTADSTPPPGLDYEMWLGPAPFRPYNKQRVHYYFRFFWDYSGGQMTNWGAHHLDIAQWGLGMDDSGPVEISATAKFDAEKRFETPHYFAITYKYANGVTVFCESPAQRTGTTFIGDQGQVHVNRGVLECSPEEIADSPAKDSDVKLYVSRQHHQNWLECIKTRKAPICSVEVGHRSATVCHLGNIAVRTGKTIKWDPVKEVIVGDADLAKWTGKPYRAPWQLPV